MKWKLNLEASFIVKLLIKSGFILSTHKGYLNCRSHNARWAVGSEGVGVQYQGHFITLNSQAQNNKSVSSFFRLGCFAFFIFHFCGAVSVHDVAERREKQSARGNSGDLELQWILGTLVRQNCVCVCVEKREGEKGKNF